jgi:hypothetical protein
MKNESKRYLLGESLKESRYDLLFTKQERAGHGQRQRLFPP